MTTLRSDTYLEPFIKATYYRAFRFAYYMVAYRPAAEIAAQDITQEAYERLLTKLKRDPSMLKRLGKEQMTTYLLTIIRYLGYELSRDSQHFVEIDSIHVDQDSDQDIEYPTPAADVETLVLANDATSNLFRHIRALPEQQRNIIELRLEGYSHGEIAAQLLISIGAVKTALHRARRSLHIWIKEDDQPETILCQEEVSSSNSEERTILSSIEQLPDPYRMVVALRMVKRMSYGDIAQFLHRNVKTVRSQYHRGKRLLANPQEEVIEKKQAEAKAAAELQAKLAYKDQLPIHWRQAVELHYLQTLDIKEVAKRLGKPESTIKRWIRRAMEYLQSCAASTCIEHAQELSRRSHRLPSKKQYQYIHRVSSTYRPVIKLYYEQSLSIAEIAEQLNLSESAVKMHLKRGRAQLEDQCKLNIEEEAV